MNATGTTASSDTYSTAQMVPVVLKERVFPGRDDGHVPNGIVPVLAAFGSAVDVLIVELAALQGGRFRMRNLGTESIFDADEHLAAAFAKLESKHRSVFGTVEAFRDAMHAIAAFYAGAEILCLTPVSAPGVRADARNPAGMAAAPLGLAQRSVQRAYLLSLILAAANVEAKTASGQTMERGIAPAWRTRTDFAITTADVDAALAGMVPGWSLAMPTKQVANGSKAAVPLHALRCDPARLGGLVRGQRWLNDLLGSTVHPAPATEQEQRHHAVMAGVRAALAGSLAAIANVLAPSRSAVATSEMVIAIVTAADAKLKSWYELSAEAIRTYHQAQQRFTARCAKLKVRPEEVDNLAQRLSTIGFDITELGPRGCEAIANGISASGAVASAAAWTFTVRARGTPAVRPWPHPSLDALAGMLGAEPELGRLLYRLAQDGLAAGNSDPEETDEPTGAEPQTALSLLRDLTRAARNQHGVPMSRRQEHDLQVSPVNDGIHDVRVTVIPERCDATTHRKPCTILRLDLGLLGTTHRIDFRMGRNYAFHVSGTPDAEGGIAVPMKSGRYLVGWSANKRKQRRGEPWTPASIGSFALTLGSRRDGLPCLTLRTSLTIGSEEGGILPQAEHPSGDPVDRVAAIAAAFGASLSVHPDRAADRTDAIATINALLASGQAVRVCAANRGLTRDVGWAVGELVHDPAATGPICGRYTVIATGIGSQRNAETPTSAPALGVALRDANGLLGRLKQAATRGLGCVLIPEVVAAYAAELGQQAAAPSRPWLPRPHVFQVAGAPPFDPVGAVGQLLRWMTSAPTGAERLPALGVALRRGAAGPLSLWHAPVAATLAYIDRLLIERARRKTDWNAPELSPADQLQWAEHLRLADALANSLAYLGEPPLGLGQRRPGPRDDQSRIWQRRIESLRTNAIRVCASRLMGVARQHRCHLIAMDSLDGRTSSAQSSAENSLWTRLSPATSTEIFQRAARKAGFITTVYRGGGRMGRDVGLIQIPAAYVTTIALDRTPAGTRRTICLRRGSQVFLPTSATHGNPGTEFTARDADVSAALTILDRTFGAGLHRSWIWTKPVGDGPNPVLVPLANEEHAFLQFLTAHGLRPAGTTLDQVAFVREGHWYRLIDRPAAAATPATAKRGARAAAGPGPTKIRLAVHGLASENRWSASSDEVGWKLPD